VRQLFFAEEVVRVVDAELRGIQDDQDFRDQRFHDGLTRLAADETGHVVAMLAQKLLESAQDGDSFAYRRCFPQRLCLPCAEHGILDITGAGTRQLSQYLSGCRIRGYDCAVPYSCLSGHV